MERGGHRRRRRLKPVGRASPARRRGIVAVRPHPPTVARAGRLGGKGAEGIGYARPNNPLAGPTKFALNRIMSHRTRPNRPVLGQTQVWPTLC